MKTLISLVACTLFTGIILTAGVLIAQESSQYLYTCKCGKKCDCNALETKPGKCPCGKKLRENYILGLNGDKAIICDCGGGCVCDLSDTDSEMCSCGMPVDDISLKGLYACACGPECSCNSISKQPGTCQCGKDLRLVE